MLNLEAFPLNSLRSMTRRPIYVNHWKESHEPLGLSIDKQHDSPQSKCRRWNYLLGGFLRTAR